MVSGCATEECLSDLRHVDEILPDVFSGCVCWAVAVPVSFPVVEEMASAVVVEEAALVGVSPVEEEIFVVGVGG